MSSRRYLLEPRTVVLGQWYIIRRIGTGTFSEIYEAGHLETRELVAVKVEKKMGSSLVELPREHECLRRLQASPWVPRVIHYGEEAGRRYLIMQRLGDNLSSLRRMRKGQRFSFETSILVAVKMLDALESIHDLGVVHRDVKPSNCLVGLGDKEGKLYMVDFGLAKQHMDDEGNVLEGARPSGGGTGRAGAGSPSAAAASCSFMGTSLYASPAAHELKDLGRKDDLWSIWFMLVDLVRPDLPWRAERKLERPEVHRQKREVMRDLAGFLRPVRGREGLRAFAEELMRYDYAARPDYAKLRGLLLGMAGGEESLAGCQLDWVREEYNRRCQARDQKEAEAEMRSPVTRRLLSRYLERKDALGAEQRLSALLAGLRDGRWPAALREFLPQWSQSAEEALAASDKADPAVFDLLCEAFAARQFGLDPEALASPEVTDMTLHAQVLLERLERVIKSPALVRRKREMLKQAAALERAAAAGRGEGRDAKRRRV